MKNFPLALRALTLAACLVALGWSAQPAQAAPTTAPTPPAAPAPRDHTSSGTFVMSDGSKGTFVETYTVASKVVTDTIVYSLADSTETRTVTTTSTANTDGTTTVDFSDLGFGATAAATATIDYAAPTDGGTTGTGTFTAADGTAGTLTSVVIETRQTSINSLNMTSTAGALTRQVRVDEKNPLSDTLKVADVDVLGTLTMTTIIRFDGMHHPRPQ